MGMGRELKDFVASFNAGYKLWDDAEYKKALINYYKSGKGHGTDSMSEDDLVKYGYDPKLEGTDKGISMAAARFRAAQERGDAADIKKQAENTIAVKRFSGAPPAALPGVKNPTAAPKEKRTDAGSDGMSDEERRWKERTGQLQNTAEDTTQTPNSQTVADTQPEQTETQDQTPVDLAQNTESALPVDDMNFAAAGGMIKRRYAEGGGPIG